MGVHVPLEGDAIQPYQSIGSVICVGVGSHLGLLREAITGGIVRIVEELAGRIVSRDKSPERVIAVIDDGGHEQYRIRILHFEPIL
jgi:hypothetical protein